MDFKPPSEAFREYPIGLSPNRNSACNQTVTYSCG